MLNLLFGIEQVFDVSVDNGKTMGWSTSWWPLTCGFFTICFIFNHRYYWLNICVSMYSA